MSYKNKFNINRKIPPKKISIEQEIINIFTILQKEICAHEILKSINISKYSLEKIDNKNITKKISIKALTEIIKELIKNIISKLSELYSEKIQLSNYIKKLESDIRKNMKEILENNNKIELYIYKIQKFSKINDEYEKLKEKVKYKKGKFLNDDKKDNEIFILKQENSNLKTEINKLTNKLKEYKINRLTNKHINIRIFDSPEKSMKLNLSRSNQTHNNNQIINNNIIINSFNRNKSKHKNNLNNSFSNKRFFNKKGYNEMNKTTNLFFKDKAKNRVIKNV